MRCLIVDDHPLITAGTATLLKSDFPDFEISIATTVRSAINYIDTNEDGEVSLVLLDYVLPDGYGIDILKHINNNKRQNDFLCILLSGSKNKVTVALCKQLGAKGYICKTDDMNQLLMAISTVCGGGEYFGDGKTNYTHEDFLDKASRLTNRQREVLDLVLAGYSNKKIASTLNIDCGTVRNYISVLLAAFSVTTRLEVTTNARDNGYVPKITPEAQEKQAAY